MACFRETSRRHPCHLLLVGILLFLVPSRVGAGEDVNNLSVLDTVSPPANSIRSFFYLALAIVGAIFVLYEGVLFFFVVRYRKRPEQDDSEPPQVYGSKPIEVAWTVLPLLIVFVLFLITVRNVSEIRKSQVPPGAMKVTVVGHQWWWEYRYDDHGVITANEMHVPVGRPVYLELRSADVIHDFWAPRLTAKADVIPGKTNHTWFQADAAGEFGGQCAEFCGAQHANMMIRIVAQSPAEFDDWLKKQQASAANLPAVQSGKDTFLRLACINCHRVAPTEARGIVGPDLTHLMSRRTLLTGMIDNTPDELYRWIAQPEKIKPGCLMPNMQLDSKQVKSVVSYLQTLE
jgi:cytochrome c oxidase subunit 2